MNPHIESLVFEAQTLDNTTINLRFHEIGTLNTADDEFVYRSAATEAPVRCRYSSLRLLEPEAIFEARLQALGSSR
jgi:hypothetical protein